ncbi:MAG: ABC transporter permease [Parachlamydiaceae bacterium]|nr:ABC transporter permease [Parachlamydiaceae bacterium]
MWIYLLRRLLLLPLTLFCIILVNFVIINLAPGDPTSYSETTAEGNATRRADRSTAFNSDERYLHFREFYGLTLPILFNTWPSLSLDDVKTTLWKLANKKESPQVNQEISPKDYNQLRILFGDQSRFIMPHLLQIIEDPNTPKSIQQLAFHFFVRGGTRSAYLGSKLSPEEKAWNRKITQDDLELRSFVPPFNATPEVIDQNVKELSYWYTKNQSYYHFEPDFSEKISIFFFETRFIKYMNRVIHLDFGSMRNDSSRSVISEVAKRIKYSLTLSLLPMIVVFMLCQLFGLLMAYYQNRWPDYSLNLFFLILYAIPVFVVAPFLIQNIALYHHFPFTDIPIPIYGFTNPDRIYNQETSFERLLDILQHIALPIVAVMYGSLASQARLSRTVILEVLRQDYVRTAKAKGLPPSTIMFKHIGRNASITLITSLASSLGVILGGSLIVETLFGINGFGKFFYDAVLNRDYNVIMFSALVGSFLTLMGYLIADLAYMWLDPRITLD